MTLPEEEKAFFAPSYPVDANHAFNDMLFFNLIIKASKSEWRRKTR